MPNFKRRHYETIAVAFERARLDAQRGLNEDGCTGIAFAATRLADAFGRDNPLFNRVRFLQACDCEDYATELEGADNA